MIIQAEMRRKQSEYEGEACVVDKVIELPSQRFKQFSRALLADYDFIAENKNAVQYEADSRHCLLILDVVGTDGFLVDPQGYNYARYAAAQKLRSSKTDNRQVICPEKQYMFNGKLICGNCGSPFRVKNSRTLRYWMCLNRASGKDNCTVPQIPESEIVAAFLRLCNKLQYNKFILKDTLEKLNTIQNRRMLWSPDIIELNKKISEIISQNQMLAVLKQQGLVDPDIFISKTNALAEQLRKLKLAKERLLESKTDDTLSQTKQIIEVIRDIPDFLEEFDAELFDELVDKIIVEDNTHLRFRLKNGLEFRETIRRAVR